MIISAILYIFAGILNGLVFVLPDASDLTGEISNAISFFSTYWNNWNVIFPLDTAVTVIGLVVALEVTILTYHLMMWVVRLIRG